MAFTQDSDPVTDLGIGKVKAYQAGDRKEIHEISVKVWNTLKEYHKVSSLLSKKLNCLYTNTMTFEEWSENPENKKIFERAEQLSKEILMNGGSKHWLRTKWCLVKNQ